MPADDLDDVGAGKQVVDEARRDHGASLSGRVGPKTKATARVAWESAPWGRRRSWREAQMAKSVSLAPPAMAAFSHWAASHGRSRFRRWRLRYLGATLKPSPRAVHGAQVGQRQAVFGHQRLDLGNCVGTLAVLGLADLFVKRGALRQEFFSEDMV